MWTGYYGIESSLNFLLIFQDREDAESDNIDEDDKITNDEDDEMTASHNSYVKFC